MYPNLVDANYQLGLALQAIARTDVTDQGDKARAERSLRRAEYAPSNTYFDFFYSASAAADLEKSFDVTHDQMHRDYARAMVGFGKAIDTAGKRGFKGDAYAYFGKAELEGSGDPATARSNSVAARNNFVAARNDFRRALLLSPDDNTIEAAFGYFLGKDTTAGKQKIKAAATLYERRRAKDEQQTGAAGGEPVAFVSPLRSATSCKDMSRGEKSDSEHLFPDQISPDDLSAVGSATTQAMTNVTQPVPLFGSRMSEVLSGIVSHP
jgi:tetratricopeptide (TPR) repeat protein